MNKKNLPKEALKHFNLEDKTELFWSRETKMYVDENNNPVQALFVGLDNLWVNYTPELKSPDHYLLKNDPWFEKIGAPSALSELSLPRNATHYVLGNKRVEEGSSSGNNRYLSYKEYYPIVFLKAE